MSLLDDLFSNRKKKQEAKILARPVTKADLDALRTELTKTPEDKEDEQIYKKWMSMPPQEKKNKWVFLSIKQRNRLSKIVEEHKKVKEG